MTPEHQQEILALAKEIESNRIHRPGPQRRRQWADRLRRLAGMEDSEPAIVHNSANPRCEARLPHHGVSQEVAEMTCPPCLHDVAHVMRRSMAMGVAQVWTRNNGWIPGGARSELETVLQLDLPLPAVGGVSGDHQFVYKTSDPERRHHGRETYEEWSARQ